MSGVIGRQANFGVSRLLKDHLGAGNGHAILVHDRQGAPGS